MSSGRHAYHLHVIRTSCRWHLHVMRMTFVWHLHVIHTSKTCVSCLISCSTTPGDNSIYLLCCFSRKFSSIGIDSSSQLVLILSLIFGWTLSVKDVSLVSFARKFCNLFLDQFGVWRLLLIHILFLTWSAYFGSIVFICYIVSGESSSQLVLTVLLNWYWY